MSHPHEDSSAMTGGSHHGMVPYLHFVGGDILLFQSLAPKSAGAIAGASIVLFCLGLFDRLFSAWRSIMEARWRKQALEILSQREIEIHPPSPSVSMDNKASDTNIKVFSNTVEEMKLPDSIPSTKPSRPRPPRTFAPAIFAHDMSRGVMHAVQALLGYTLMLSVMTFQATYLICIIAGLGIGEMLFGRLKGVRDSSEH